MTLVEAEGQVVALYNQNELHQVAPGNEAEFALKTLPGRIIKGKVDSVIWAQGQGQLPASGTMPMTGVMAMPPGRFAVKFDIAERDKALVPRRRRGGRRRDLHRAPARGAHPPQGDPARRART